MHPALLSGLELSVFVPRVQGACWWPARVGCFVCPKDASHGYGTDGPASHVNSIISYLSFLDGALVRPKGKDTNNCCATFGPASNGSHKPTNPILYVTYSPAGSRARWGSLSHCLSGQGVCQGMSSVAQWSVARHASSGSPRTRQCQLSQYQYTAHQLF